MGERARDCDALAALPPEPARRGGAGERPGEAKATPGLRRAALGAIAATLLAASGLFAASTPSALETIRARGELRWGADQEGGGPYVFPRDDDPRRVTGFEVELAELLARSLGVRARFVQGPWDRMPDLLRTRKIDLVLNGYEWTPERAEAMEPTIPYYVYAIQLLVRRDDSSIGSFEDLARPVAGRRRRVGVLGGSAAEGAARRRLGSAAEVVLYDGNTDAMREVETGKLDATLQDTPIAVFYARRFPGLRPVGAAVEPGYYVAYVRKGETSLRDALNGALLELIRSGELERLYRRWGLWDERQEELRRIAAAGRFFGYPEAPSGAGALSLGRTAGGGAAPARPRGFTVVRRYGTILLQSAGMTVVLSVLSFPLAIALGLLVALGRLYGPPWLRAPLAAYVEFLRGTPLMLQLYFVFFFLPEVGIAVPAFWTAVLGLAVNYSAYESEIYRAGLEAVPRGQMEAALSLGMSRALALRRIVVPQAVRIVIPPVVNDFIALFKDTSVCSVVTVVELTKRFSMLSQSTQATVELMLLTALLYLAMSLPLSALAARLERRLGRERPA